MVELREGVVRQARVAVGGVATKPWRDPHAEQVLIGRPLTPDNARRAAQALFAPARARAHNGYKIPLGVETVTAALMIAAERARS